MQACSFVSKHLRVLTAMIWKYLESSHDHQHTLSREHEYSTVVMNHGLHPSQAQHACNLLVNTGNFSYVYTVAAFLGH